MQQTAWLPDQDFNQAFQQGPPCLWTGAYSSCRESDRTRCKVASERSRTVLGACKCHVVMNVRHVQV